MLALETCVFTFAGSSTIKSISDIVQGKSLGVTQYFMVSVGGATVVTFLVAGTIIGRRAINKMREEGEKEESEMIAKVRIFRLPSRSNLYSDQSYDVGSYNTVRGRKRGYFGRTINPTGRGRFVSKFASPQVARQRPNEI
jgi:hypothetical protein